MFLAYFNVLQAHEDWPHLADMIITRTPKVCKIMAFMAVILGLGLLFYILLGFR